MDKIEYFFYEWLIVSKNLDREQFDKLTNNQFLALKLEFMKYYEKL